MRYKKAIVAALAVTAVSLPPFGVNQASAAPECEVSGTITGTELVSKIAQCPTSTIEFTDDTTVNGTVNFTNSNGLTTFHVASGKVLTFTTTKGNALQPYTALTFNNEGTVEFESAGRGISAKGKSGNAPVFTFSGGVFNFNTKGYAVEAERTYGSFQFENTTVNVTLSEDQVEGAFNTGKYFGDTVWNNSTLNVDDFRDNERFKKTAAAHNIIYSESVANWTFENGSVFNSNANVYYNLSFSAPTKFNVTGGSEVTLTTKDGALMKKPKKVPSYLVSLLGEYLYFDHPQVGVNTKGGQVNITKGGKLIVVDNVTADHDKHGIEFQNATYTIDGGTLITPSAGTDADGISNGEGNLVVTGDSAVEIGNGNKSDRNLEKLSVVIDGGTVVLPSRITDNDSITIKNSRGDKLDEFVSNPAGYTGLEIDGVNYPISKNSLDGKKHVWAPPVNVYYYDRKDEATSATVGDSGVTPQAREHRKIIRSTTVDNPFNNVDPVDGEWKNAADDTDFSQDFKSGTSVKEDTFVYLVPPVTTKTITVFKDGNATPEEGIVNLPEGATVAPEGEGVDTSTTGNKTLTVTVTFPGGATRTVEIPVVVVLRWTPINPVPVVTVEKVTVHKGDVVPAKDGLVNLPEDATVVIVDGADTSEPGETTQKVKITFSDGSSVIKTVPVTVKDVVPWVTIEPAPTPEPIGVDGVQVCVNGALRDTAGLRLPAGVRVVEIVKDVDTSVIGTSMREVRIEHANGKQEVVTITVSVQTCSFDGDDSTPSKTAEPTVEEPTAEEPTAEEPTVEEPTTEPTVDGPMVGEPTTEPTKEPTAEPVVPGKGSSSGKPAKPSSGLASTGSSTVPLLGGGLALLVMGAGAVVARRRLRK